MTRVRLFSALLLLVLLTPAAFAQPVLSEIRIDQPSTDNDEYFELAAAPGASLDGFTYLVIGDGSGASGVIESVTDLIGSVVDANGYFVAAEGTFTLGVANLTTSLNFENSDNVTHLLVQGFNGSDGDDLDTDDDGVLDVEPWTSIADCVALIESVGSGDLTYCANTNGPDGTFVPGHTIACPDGFDVGVFDPVGGIDTPGADNICSPQTSARLSEIRIDQPSTDNDEYFELTGTPGETLDGLTYLVIGDGTGASGVIESVTDLTASAIDANGFFVAAESTFTIGAADLTTTFNFENSDNVTHLLVQDFTGADGTDLDTDDDGTLDATPWSLIVDCVALIESVGSGDLTYCPTSVGPDGTFVPGHPVLCPGGWEAGAFDPASGEDTPGAENLCAAPTASLLVINEVDYDQPSSDTAEFLEIKNNDTVPVDLSGYEVQLINGSGGGAAPYGTLALPSVTLDPGAYFVLCADPSTVSNCDLAALSSIQNGGPDAVALLLSGTVIDAVSYEGDTAAPFTEGSGAGVIDPGGSGDDNLSISRTPDGADTNDNSVDFQTVCSTPGAANSTETSSCPSVAPPVFVINEIDYDQPSSDTAEFIEIRNNGAGDASLAGFELQLVNGNGGTPYDTISLPAATVTAGGYFVVCADALAVPNCDLEGFSSVQNGAPDAVALVQGTTIIDVVSYEGEVAAPYFEGTGAPADSGATGEDNKGISRTPDGSDTNDNSIDFAFVCVTPGSGNTTETTGCSATGPTKEIFEIQGSGSLSPFDGSTVTTLANVVTAVGPEGFFVQTPTARSDGDIDTSDGIYVFTGSAPTVAVGDLVDISAQVDEFFDFTELVGATVTIVGTETVPAPVVWDATVPSPDPTTPSCSLEFECYEGMVVTIASGTITSGNQSFNSDPVAEAYAVATTQRAFRETGIEFPGIVGLPVWDGNPELFEIDPDALGLPNETLLGGSTFQATGAIAFEFGGYELWPTSLTVTPAILPGSVPTRGAGEIGIASLNLFRLFDDVANGSETVLPTAEYQLRLEKASAYIREVLLSPEVLAVQEVESLAVLQDLAARVAADDATVSYTGYLIEGNDVGGIDVGFLVRSTVTVNAVTQLGATELLTFDGSLLHDRPPLVLDATTNGYDFQVMGIHNRSLSSIDSPTSGPRVRQKRLEQAQSIAQKVQDIQNADPSVKLFVVGDFNAFEFTDGYVDVTGQIRGVVDPTQNLLSDIDLVSPDLESLVDGLPAEERYSFIFRGSAQALDQALASQEAVADIVSFAFGRGNADADELAIESPGPLRSSDHDGYVIGVLTAPPDSDFDGVLDEADLCPATTIPESVPTRRLGFRRWALVDGDTEFDTRGRTHLSFDTEATGGCSCEQILEVLDLPRSYERLQRRYGCSTLLMKYWVYVVRNL
ncbi:MAG: lamin tail domain-containing protein [Acidobacteriota bacterium]